MVGAAFGCQPSDAQLAGVSASTPVRHGRRGRAPAALSSSRAQAASGRAPQPAARSSAWARGSSGSGALAVPAQGRAEFRERVGALEQRGRAIKHGHQFAEQRNAFLPAA